MTIARRHRQRSITLSGRQPAGKLSLDRTNRLTDGIICAIPFNGSAYEIVRGPRVTLGSGGNIVVAGNRGYGLLGTGTTARASLPLNLSGLNVITISWWMNWSTFADDSTRAMEYTANALTNDGFFICPNSPTSSNVALQIRLNAGDTLFTIPRPSLGWHHWVVQFDGSAVTKVVNAWIDGVAQTTTEVVNSAAMGTLAANSTLYLLSRGNASFFGVGYLHDLLIYDRAITNNEVQELYTYPASIYAPVPRLTPTANFDFYATAQGEATATVDLATAAGFRAAAVGAVSVMSANLVSTAQLVMNLVNRSDVAWVSLANIRYSVWAELTEQSLATKLALGTTEATDANGLITIPIPGGVVGQQVYVLLGDATNRRYAGIETLE